MSKIDKVLTLYCHMNEKKISNKNLNQLQVDITVTSKSVMLSKTFWVAISAGKSYTSNLPKTNGVYWRISALASKKIKKI